MAEYKYRALGWQDDDIASLNVVDGTAADNQVELQITKQGAGGTIDGPAIKGADGISVDKVADSSKEIVISGSGLVQSSLSDESLIYGRTNNADVTIVYAVYPSGNTIPLRLADGRLQAIAPTEDLDCTNKKYADEHYVSIPDPAPTIWSVLVYSPVEKKYTAYRMDIGPLQLTMPYRDTKGNFKVGDLTADDDGQYCANKKYVDDTVATSSATVDGTSIVKDTDGKIQLNQEYIDYLDNQLYQPPAISVFTMLDAAGAVLPTSNELGTTLSAAAFNHQETNIKNIQGDNVELHINNAAAATTSTVKKDVATKVTLTTAQSITSSTKFTLKGTNTKGAAFSRDYQVNFYRYAYTATTDATTAPTSGATQQAAVSTFASNGSTFNYTKGGYIYFYTDNTGKKVQTNVLGQWADVDTTDMGKVTLTQNNGATHEYTCYRIGPFIETGSAKYRV